MQNVMDEPFCNTAIKCSSEIHKSNLFCISCSFDVENKIICQEMRFLHDHEKEEQAYQIKYLI